MPTLSMPCRAPQVPRPYHPLASKAPAQKRANPLRRQRGFGLGQVLVVLLLVVFFVNLGIKMVPSYLSFMQVRSVMDRVVERPELVGSGRRAVLAAVIRQLGIDNLRSVEAQDFSVSREADDTLLSVDYQVQRHIGFNVDVLMHFEHAVVLPQP